MPKLLVISTMSYDAAETKGVASLLRQFDEGGFFERVVFAFPFVARSRTVSLSNTQQLLEMGPDWFPGAGRWRWLRRAIAPLHVLAVALRLAAVIRREGIDIIRATEPCYCGLIAMVTAMLTGRPWCVSLHADFDRRFALDGPAVAATVFGSRALANAIERLVISRAPMTLPIRESLIGYLKARGARADRIRVIPHGLDISVFATPSAIDVSARFDVPSGHRIVSFVGRLARDNYIDDVLDVARHIAATRGDVVMLMIGGGTEEARVRAEVSGNPGLARVVRMPGYQPRDVVAAVRQASAVSLCLMGGFSLIEACAAASPVVAYDVEWHGELVRDGETGYLIAEHDLAGLYVAVDRLLDRPDYARKLGQAAQHLALARHDHAASAAAKRKAYAELLELENRGVRCAFRRSAP